MKKILILILLIQGISAGIGGEELIRTNGMGIPKEWLANSPFESFIIPGMILGFIVGGTSIVASWRLYKNHKHQFETAAVAGFGIQIWIFVQIYMIRQTSILQALYFASGTIILALTIKLLKART